ncbi:MAG: sulfide/dihydroorotate dehydrogenase-like FAD/NAD-binding protein [Candidatus Omnitrophica bacterium]|nr:sulfide/dihydroorotate dehydrogenase-like FAD/NAD-binding protein [Candidatus Omnitrophota bacterium]MDD5690339.1 sulfide/dihydroorotate dehydrogenase-like FAD/NAD-binding protein [Candidatus Omnitrophota bacterium]
MKIISREAIIDSAGVRIIKLSLIAPEISQKAKPGQFVVVMVDERGERVPLTIVDVDINAGSITLIFQEAGLTTRLLGALNAGDSLYALVGPLGHPTEIKKFGKVILAGGGVGIAEILPVARALKDAGNHITAILGSRNKDLLILEAELKGASDQIYIMTDDGSYGRKGFTTDMLKELLDKDKYDLIYSVGPIPMMKRVAAVSREYNTKTLVSLNALMVDATGMCGCCRVSVFGQVKFSCVDGPDFDGHGVDWEELEKRNKVYSVQEKHICNLFPAS